MAGRAPTTDQDVVLEAGEQLVEVLIAARRSRDGESPRS